ncbi:MAG: M23 family metallopeptidase [Rhizobiaceae bacterium]|nr:M23 family metallopeptidase [Rhizobiaceae bacterium]
MAALDGRQQLAAPANSFISKANFSSDANNTPTAAKGNRIGLDNQYTEPESNVMMVSTVNRENDREVVKVRPFLIVKAPLAIAPKQNFTYPKFDPLVVFSESGNPQPVSKSSDSIYGADVESEVSIKISPFPYENPKIAFASRQRTAEVEELVRRAGPGLSGNATSIASLSNFDPVRFSDNEIENFTTPGVVITDENVTVVNKIIPEEYSGVRYEDRIVKVRAQSGLATILSAEGMDEAEAGIIEKVLSADLGNQELMPGDKLRLAYKISPGSISISRISVYRGISHLVSVARSDTNQFVYSKEPARPPALALSTDVQPTVLRAKLPSTYDGINQAALSEGLTSDLVNTLVRIFAFDVDFRSKVTPFDEITAFVSLEDGKTTPSAESEILYTSIKLNNVNREYYRFRDSETNRVDYYDPTGKSAKKFLLRKPVPNARFSSAYGWRIHPISRVRKMHWGVDWAAPRGTPILAAGNGIIEKAGWAGGRGKQTVIKHANGYVSSYSHQAAFAKGIVPGTRVRQGQIIGYVGTTGNSTGNHLHYEVSVNGNKVNSMRIRLPKGKILKGEELLSFEAERVRIDELLKKREDKDPTRLALN